MAPLLPQVAFAKDRAVANSQAVLRLTVRRTVSNLQLFNELLLLRIDFLGAGKQLTPELARGLASAYSIALRRRYPLTQVCRAWGLSRSNVYRNQQQRARPPLKTAHPLSDAEIVQKLREIVVQCPFRSERHRKLWARLRHCGIEVSRERVRRLLREHRILPQPGLGILTDQPDVMWGIDSTHVRTTYDGVAHVLFAIDHCTSECMAIGVAGEETAEAWVVLVKRAIVKAFGSLSPGIAVGLTVRHDNHQIFQAEEFRKPLRSLGIGFSRIPILSPQMNGCAERFVRTLRENLLSIRYFERLMDLVQATREFQTAYNGQWLVARAEYRTPTQIRDFLHFLAHRRRAAG